MIPKKIHTFWLSSDPLTPDAAANIDTWREHNPNYDVIVHGADEFRALEDTCEYYRVMLRDHRWCFAADYLRAKVLLAEGGWYTDADARCHKPLDGIYSIYGERKRYLCKEAPNGVWLECGVMAFEPGDEILKLMVSWYENWREGDEFPVMPFVMADIINANGLTIGPLLPDEVLSGKRLPNSLYRRPDGEWGVRLNVEPSDKSFATHHFTHTGY